MPHQAEPEQDNEPSLENRLLTALLAPLFFNFSLFIILALISRRSRLLGMAVLSHGIGWLALLIALPAIAGFWMGTAKFATFLGHLFFTNMEHERDIRITVVSWVGFITVIYLTRRILFSV